MTIVASCNARPLDDEALRSHLGKVCRLEHVGVLLGSGASRDAGGQTMTELWETFAKEEASSLAVLAAAHYVPALGIPNVEELLSTLNGDLSSQQRRGAPDPDLLKARNALYRAVIAASLLQSECWMDPLKVSADKAISAHQELISKLIGMREVRQSAPAVFTTNYDIAIEWAADSLDIRYYNGFDGVHLRQFSPQNFDLQLYNAAARGSARFGVYGFTLVKLHGSLTWRYADTVPIESPTQIAYAELKEFMDGAASDIADRLMILPSSGKYADTTQYMYGEMLRRFGDFLSTPQTCLVASGYSFRDEHINRLIETGLNTPSVQLVLYLPEATIDEDGSLKCISDRVATIVRRAGPRCTVVGNGARAHFSALVGDLPGIAQSLEVSAVQ